MFNRCDMKHIQFLLPLFFISIQLSAQIPVRDEPHHKPVLENEYVRLLDVHINPGDTSLYHSHSTASVIVFISYSMMGAQPMGKEAEKPNEVFPGQTSFAPFDVKPVTHRVFNSGSNVFHVMDIELVKQNPLPDSCEALSNNNIQTTINEKLVRVYKFDVSNANNINMQPNSCAHLLICTAGKVSTANKTIATGGYVFIPSNTVIDINNKEVNNSTCVLLELK